ncbi:FGGY-family carbohydrate kinase [Methylocapsa sp. S129]|uniref:FGGY-family carbohydrate kinase n=1 Tax=Methylocapsa sp. S129 TaxID=1641869 RepID=UPI00131A90BC|nr:FGGY family carbohydrate kinase [Methylocapsa sp. S129]
MNGAVAVLDIGKTNVKLATFAREGALLWEHAMPNRVAPGPPYPHMDIEAIGAFLIAALKEANKAHEIATIVATTHACTGALIDDNGLLLPVMDYEFAGVEEVEPFYAPIRPPFSESFSPILPAGLNLARQVAWQKRRFPEAFAEAKYYLTYPQYWAWRLCGIAASEVTFLGAHTELWAPLAGRYSSLAAALDLDRRTPPMRRAYDRLGPVKPDVAAAAGLREDVGVLCGVHDSNASLLPHLASRKAPFTIVSTGTWVILMAVGLSLDGLDPADDTLANVDVEGRPVATARFMGGREYAAIAGAPASPDAASLARVIASGAMALPCFAGQGGPFPSRKGEIRGDVAPADLPALATLYLALMSDLMLDRLGVKTGDLIVEGSLAANPAYCALLAALRPSQAVYAGSDAAGTARGAALLAQWPPRDFQPPALIAAAPSAVEGLQAYRRAWMKAVLGA